MDVAGSIFELRPPNFRKIHIFWRCSNDSSISFGYFQWYKSYKKSKSLWVHTGAVLDLVSALVSWIIVQQILLIFCIFPTCTPLFQPALLLILENFPTYTFIPTCMIIQETKVLTSKYRSNSNCEKKRRLQIDLAH